MGKGLLMKRWLFIIFVIKILLLLFFSSNYQNQLFIPFVEHFLSNLDNPWQYFFDKQVDKFPYPPLMLYILSLFYLPYCFFGSADNVILQNFFFKLPIVLADMLIVYVFLRMFPKKIKEVTIFYFASPIIIYASYMHSQLDLLPISALVLSIYLLTIDKIISSAVVIGFAMSIKFNVAVALPLMATYMLRNIKDINKIDILYLISIPFAIYLLISVPYLLSEGYYKMVLTNPKQMTIFDSAHQIGDLKIYFPILAVMIIYGRFVIYKKINNDLFFSFLGLLFSVFVLLIFPAPGWYIWMTPFLGIFFIEYYPKNFKILYLYIALNAAYVLYFLVFQIPEYHDLIFLRMPIDIKIYDEKMRNISYTFLEFILLATVYSLYKFGVKSNAIYKKQGNFVIGIGGDSASGKTTLLSDLKLILGKKMLELEGDAEHKWMREDKNWHSFTHLNPKANYIHKQAYYLFDLKAGGSIYRSDYEHKTGAFTSPQKVEPKDFIVLSGLHPFFLPVSRKAIDFKIYLDTEESLKRHWKIVRDARERGYSQERVIEQIEKRANDAQKYIQPQKEFADLVISYFAEDNIKSDVFQTDLNLKLKLTLSSNFQIEQLIERFQQEGVEICWDYPEDLKNQHLILNHKPSQKLIKNIAEDIIPNLTELIIKDAEWLDGYRGFVQLIIVLILGEKMREVG